VKSSLPEEWVLHVRVRVFSRLPWPRRRILTTKHTTRGDVDMMAHHMAELGCDDVWYAPTAAPGSEGACRVN
jgi:hypothetical protein